MKQIKEISGNIVDVLHQRIFPGTVRVSQGKVVEITNNLQPTTNNPYILPGFVDAHIHIESSMLPPAEFARMALIHGTVATVSDPHEIANVCGIAGIEYMIEQGKQSPLTIAWGAPSCVPATGFETSGAVLDSDAVSSLLSRSDISYLSEVMNFPGVIHRDTDLLKKIHAAKQTKKPVDGHAPGLRGNDLLSYVSAGISTDHESYQLDEALEKISLGMKIIIREGSAAKNFDALHPLLKDHWKLCMFGSDDKHPHDLIHGHIDQVVSRAISLGYDPLHVLWCACVHPVQHYALDIGLLQPGDPADFIVVNDLREFSVMKTVKKGMVVSEDKKPLFDRVSSPIINHFSVKDIKKKDLLVETQHVASLREHVIQALDGQLITNNISGTPGVENDIVKIAVVCRYTDNPPAIGYIKGFGIKEGAIASTVAHDSHNIVSVGTSDEYICRAINLLISEKGGICAIGPSIEEVLPLPIAGLMSDQDGHAVAHAYTKLDALAKELGSTLTAPFMTLSFMALPVIPHLKMTDKGLFDVDTFAFVQKGQSFQPERTVL